MNNNDTSDKKKDLGLLLLLLLLGGGIALLKRPRPAEAEVVGCTDSTALNYNPLATEDNDSCVYSQVGDFNVQYHIEGEDDPYWIDIPNEFTSSPVESIWSVNIQGGELIANSTRTINWSAGNTTYGWSWQIPDKAGHTMSIRVSMGSVVAQVDGLLII